MMDDTADLVDESRSTKEMMYTPNFSSIFPQSMQNTNGGNTNINGGISSSLPTLSNCNGESRRSNYLPPPQLSDHDYRAGQANLSTTTTPMSMPSTPMAPPNAHAPPPPQPSLISSTSSPRPQIYLNALLHPRHPPQQQQPMQPIQPMQTMVQQNRQPVQDQIPDCPGVYYTSNDLYVADTNPGQLSRLYPNQHYHQQAQMNRPTQAVSPAQPPIAHYQHNIPPLPQQPQSTILSQNNMPQNGPNATYNPNPQNGPNATYNPSPQSHTNLASLLNNTNTLAPSDRTIINTNQNFSRYTIMVPSTTFAPAPTLHSQTSSQVFSVPQQAPTQPVFMRAPGGPTYRLVESQRARPIVRVRAPRPQSNATIQTPLLDSTTSGAQPNGDYGRNSGPANSSQQPQVSPRPPVPSSSPQASTVSKTNDVEIQVNPEYLNKACQFEGLPRHLVHRSLNATVVMIDQSCQTEEEDFQNSKREKEFVDRATSPIKQPLQVRRKQTPKRAKLIETKSTHSNSGSEEEIDVLE